MPLNRLLWRFLPALILAAGVNAAFSPSAEERDYAQGVIAAFEAAAGNAFTFRGRMIDEPVIRSARRVLARP